MFDFLFYTTYESTYFEACCLVICGMFIYYALDQLVERIRDWRDSRY